MYCVLSRKTDIPIPRILGFHCLGADVDEVDDDDGGIPHAKSSDDNICHFIYVKSDIVVESLIECINAKTQRCGPIYIHQYLHDKIFNLIMHRGGIKIL